jgi:PAS domain S-box-containing protein
MTFRDKMRTTIRLAAVLCGGLTGVMMISPFNAAGAILAASPAGVTHTSAAPSGVVALTLMLGCALVLGGVAGQEPPQSTDIQPGGLDQAAKAQALGRPNHSSPSDHFEPANLLQTLLDNSPDLIYFKDRASRFVCFSRSFRELLRLDDARVLKGKTDFDFFSEEHARPAFADEQEIIRTGQPLIGKLEKETHTDGRVTWALTTKLPWRNQNGQIIGTFGISKNVTDFKETELKLAYEQGLFQTLLDNIPDAIYFKDLESRFVRASSSTATKTLSRTGSGPQSADSLIGLTDFDLFGEEHARQAFADEQGIIRTGDSIIGKLEQENYANGSTTWCLSTKLPWRDKDGTVVGTFGISKDITALKEAEQKLAYERELFRALVETLPDAIYFKDRESRFVKLSRSKVERARQLLLKRHREQHGNGHTDHLAPHLTNNDKCAEYLIGKTDFDLCTEAHAQAAFEEEQRILQTGQPLVDKVERMIQDDGRPAWFLTTKMPWHDQDGNIIGTFGVTRNITALKEAEAQLEETNKRLAHTSRMAGMAEVATDVLHNVGNVLNSVNVSCSVVIDRVQSSNLDNLARIPALLREQAGRLDQFLTADPRGRQIPEYLTALASDFAGQRQFLLTELNQLRQHIDHIKQVVAMQQNYAKVAGVREVVPVEKLVADALQINASALDRHSVSLRKDYENVPPVLVDKHKALQILVNLISNAKYAVSHSPHAEKLITMRIAPDGCAHIIIQVKDNGIGIPTENLTRIFAHGFTTRRDGHGFGLHSGALAARELGGALTAQSDGPGHGATFTLRLPLNPATQAVV